MFWHIFSNKIKIMLRNKAMMFWTCIFPIILATLFNLAFSNIAEMEKWGKINIAVVKLEENKDLETTINNFSQEDEYQIFNTRYVTEEEAITLLKNDEIAGYIKIGKEAEIVVKENSLEQTILKYIVDQYYQMSSVSKNSLEYNKDILSNGVLKVFTENQSYFKDTSNSNTDYTVNYFYSLIGMACLFGGFFGLFTANETEANLSIRGARINVAPVNKIKILIAGLLAGLLIQYTEIIVLLVYLIFILGIDFGNKIIYILLISFFGCLAGVVWGILIAVMTKTSETVKSLLLVIFTITCSFLSGMMTIDIKYLIAKNIPILAKINPVNMITDGLYSLYCYDTLNRFWNNTISLGIFTVCCLALSYIFVRRKKYDSI
jgi:ABC-2 type transport system permease protein